MNKWRELKYYILIVVLISLYWILTHTVIDTPAFSTLITTTTALIAAVTFWMQLKRTQNLNEANFIMNLNKQFLDSKELTKIEHKLEVFANTVGKSEDYTGIQLDLALAPNGEDRQPLINYLVYMESLAAIIQRGVMQLGIVDDLFAYRFFLAINNPIVQDEELIKFKPYYQGCFKLAKEWTAKLQEEKREIPLAQFSLCKRADAELDKVG